jgi:hypothetical protein
MPLKQRSAKDVYADALQGPRDKVKAKLLESQLPAGVITAPIDTTSEVDASLNCVIIF